MKLLSIFLFSTCILHSSFLFAGVFDYLRCVIANSSPIGCATGTPPDSTSSATAPADSNSDTSSSSSNNSHSSTNNSYFKMYRKDKNQCCFGKVDQRQSSAYIESACVAKPIRNPDASPSPFAIDCPFPDSTLKQFYKNLPDYNKKLLAKLSSSVVTCAGFVEKSLSYYDNFQCTSDTSHFSYWQTQATTYNEIHSPVNTEVGSIHCYPKESYSNDGPNYELVDDIHPLCRFPLMADRVSPRPTSVGENATIDTVNGNTPMDGQKEIVSGQTVPVDNSRDVKGQ